MASNKVRDIAVVAQGSRLLWPKHWQQVIYKMQVMFDTELGCTVWKVYANNPAYRRYIFTGDLNAPEPPARLENVLVFESIDELDQWAAVAARME